MTMPLRHASNGPPTSSESAGSEAAPSDSDEEKRLRVLAQYDVLDSPPAEAFDRITKLATHLFDVPIAMVNFIDRNDQWCVSARGLTTDRMPREVSFCTHTIQEDGVMVVEDATQDPRFAHNPLVTHAPNIRFYAGAPLTTPNGFRLGSLCLIDDEPHAEFLEADREALQDLAGIVMDELHLRHYASDLNATLQVRKESEIRTTRLLESITDAFFALDHDWTFTYVNAQAEELLERSREELLGRNVWEVFEDAVGSTFDEQYHRAVDDQETVEFVEYYPPLNRWFEVKAFPFVGGLSVYFDDVTERIQAQQELRRERDLTEAIIDTGVAAVVTVDAEGSVNFANDRAGELLGLSVDVLEENDYLAAGPIYTLDGEEMEEEDWPYHQIMETGEPIDGQRFVIERGDGERVVSVNGAPLRTPDGEIRQVVFSMVDITPQIERQRELEAAKNEAERASRLKSSFLANVSHDVRTPISSILNLTELLLRRATDEDNRKRIRLIQRSSHRLLNTIDSVLDLSKIETGSVEVETRSLDVSDEVLGTVEIFRPQAEEHGITIETDGSARELRAELDPTMLHRILDNLVSNALKFTDAGGTVTVRVYPRDDAALSAGGDGAVVLEVEDTGVGIGEDFLPDLFEAFTRGPEQMNREGNGLGLTITKRLTELMGGTIDIESEEGVGTRCTVTLPR